MRNVAYFIQAAGKAGEKDFLALKQQAKKIPEIYSESCHQLANSFLFLVKENTAKKLVVTGDSPLYQELEGKEQSAGDVRFKECPLSEKNSKIIQKYFPFTRPVPLSKYKTTIGLGDRLGPASPGHIRLLKKKKIRPVLAQQSKRELDLTGRSFRGVLSDAVWAVFQEDYQEGFGADGDHLKTMAGIKEALAEGYTMITLDCSEHIHDLKETDSGEIDQVYQALPQEKKRALESRFLGREFTLKSGETLSFTPDDLRLNVAIYQEAVDFAVHVFQELIAPAAGGVDFEISIDETTTSTHPLGHFFVAAQLIEAGVKVDSMAPRFCGEFQKGIDYRGDIKEFTREFREHQRIAEHFGYKLSIHSGSDKFSVFPIIGRESKETFHLKTAGTNWLEAVRVIIQAEPELYRKIHAFALTRLAEAKKYYHISADPAAVPPVDSLTDEELITLLNKDDARQIIHITYGEILQARDAGGNYLFRDDIYRCLLENENLYFQFLHDHIGRHLEMLGFDVN